MEGVEREGGRGRVRKRIEKIKRGKNQEMKK